MADSNQHGYISRMYTSVSSCKFYTYFGSTTPFTLPVLLASHIRTDCAWCHLLVGQCCQVFTKCAWCCVLGVMCRPTARSSPNGYSSSSSWSTCKLQFLKTCKAGQPQTNDDHKDDWLLKHVPKTQWLKMCFKPTSVQLSTHQCKSFAKGWHHKGQDHCHTTDLDTGNSFSDILKATTWAASYCKPFTLIHSVSYIHLWENITIQYKYISRWVIELTFLWKHRWHPNATWQGQLGVIPLGKGTPYQMCKYVLFCLKVLMIQDLFLTTL